MKTLVIAEKPSVAADFARVLGKFTKNGNHFENDSMIIACAIGHIVELFMPQDIDKKFKWWSLATLPIIPEKFKTKPIEKQKDRFNELKKLMSREDVGSLINACDAGREGELIFTYIYDLAKCKKPVKRLWLSSMTKEAIIDSFKNLRDGEEMKPLQDAARCRSESDWLIGINGTRAITGRMFGQRSRQMATVGRVQTPTLTLVYEREKLIKNFIPTAFWRLRGDFSLSEGDYVGYFVKPNFKKGDNEHDRADRIWEKPEAERILTAAQSFEKGLVTDTKKRTRQNAPLLYDLTSLQRDANTRFSFPAGKTLKVAQSLYEKHKLITYPRTDAKALPEDYPETCAGVLKNLQGGYQELANRVLKNNWVIPSNKRVFDNKKISDHFAIIPTDIVPNNLSIDEEKIYDLIVRRFIAIFYPAAEFDVTTRITTLGEYDFKTEGKVLVIPGWMEVHGRASLQQDNLPPFSEKDGSPVQADVNEVALEEEATTPPPRYSEATLLSAMEGAGKFVEDEELADAMKEKGLGTPATRAQIIEHLIREHYLERDQRELIPTVKAESLIEFLKHADIAQLTSPTMTGEWEFRLHQIEHGKLSRKDFMDGITEMTEKIVQNTKQFEETKLAEESDLISPSDNLPMMESLRAYRSQDEKVTIYKIMGNRKLSKDEIRTLFKDRVLGPLDDFKSKAGKPFSAMLKMDDEYKVKFDFGSSGDDSSSGVPENIEQYPVVGQCPKAKLGLCTHKDGKIYETPTAYICENHNKEGTNCSFRVSRTLLSRAIPTDQFQKLLTEKKTDLIDKFRSKKTNRYFSAHLILKDDGTIGFEFAPKEPKAAKKTATKKVAKKKTATKKKVTKSETEDEAEEE